MNVIKEDASLIQRFIDQENSSMLNFEEFLFALRGKPNEERQNAINYVFSIFDNGSGVADVNQMKQVFNCQRHPKFTMGKLNEDQMFYLYLKNFNNTTRNLNSNHFLSIIKSEEKVKSRLKFNNYDNKE